MADRLEKQAVQRRKATAETLRVARRRFLQGAPDTAIDLLVHQGIKADPTAPDPYLELVEILLAIGRHDDALQVVAEMPSSVDTMTIRELEGICHVALGNDEAARRAASQAMERPRTLVALGTLAARQGDLPGAETLFRQALSLDSFCASSLLSLGMLLWGQGKREEAWQAVRQAVVADPLKNEAVDILVDMGSRCDCMADALAVVSQAAQHYPDSQALARTRAGLLIRSGQRHAALEACEALLSTFGVDEFFLDQALELRNNVGVHETRAMAGKTALSLCMIVKNEETTLAHCLASAKEVVAEMVVVDTGSTDRTADIAMAFGARVFSFAWNGSFADARNFALSKARGQWVLVLDADEALSARDYENILETVRSSSPQQAWSVVTRNYTRKVNVEGWTANDGAYPDEEKADGWCPSWKVRLFPNDPQIRFRGDVHELVEPSLREERFEIRKARFPVHHYGQLDCDSGTVSEKQRRYLELGRKKVQEHPDDAAALTELAIQAGEMGLFEEALGLWDRVLIICPDVIEALFNKGYVLICLKRYTEALDVSRRALELDSDHREAAFNYGTCELYAGVPGTALTRIEPIFLKNQRHPQLLALMTVLYLATSENDKARGTKTKLEAMNYDFREYLGARIAKLRELRRDELAETVLHNGHVAGVCD